MAGSVDPRTRLQQIWSALWNDDRFDDIAEFLAPDYVRHSGEGDQTREDFADTLRALRAGFPALDFNIDDILVEGDRAAWRWVSAGVHDGPYLGVPATGNHVVTSGIVISRFDGDLVAEEWASWNKVAVLHALGIIPLDRG
jgi:steroid delta-isomerase-like uncharacterized protein